MTDNLVERAARAAHDFLLADPATSSWPESNFSVDADTFRGAARAAIAAMREPTDEMTVSGNCTVYGVAHRRLCEDATNLWQAMIDAALKEGEK